MDALTEPNLSDRGKLEALLDALDASPGALHRPVCRGWVGDYQITGKHGNILGDGTGWLIYATTPERDELDQDGKTRCYGSPRRWGNIKRDLGFAQLVQDGDDEGVFRIERLPNPAEAEAIRDALGIRKRRHLTPEQLEASRSTLERARALVKSG
jgi:hypothetical protein